MTIRHFPHTRNDRPGGLLLNFASAWAFYLATVFLHLGHDANAELPATFYAFTRYVIGFIVFGAWYLRQRKEMIRGQGALRFLLMRALFNLLALVCFYQAVISGTTGKANVLNMTYPAFVAMMAGPVLGERPGARTVLFVGLAVIGMFLSMYDADRAFVAPGAGDLWGLASGVAAGFAIISLRGAARVASPVEILCWMFGLGALALLPFSIAHVPKVLTAPHVEYLFASALCGVLGQWLLSVSYRSLDAADGSVISAARIPIALLVGVLLLGEGFELFPWLGAGLILFSNLMLALQKPAATPGTAPELSSRREKRVTRK